MGSIFYWQGSLPLPPHVSWSALSAHLQASFHQQRVVSALVSPECLLFRVPFLRAASGPDAVAPFDHGQLRFDSSLRLLTFSLSLRRILLFAVPGTVFVVPVVLTASPELERLLWIVLPVAWGGTFLHIWWSVRRFRRFLRQATETCSAA
jgi:hypothetical protein